jgi:uncharacterized protein YukE
MQQRASLQQARSELEATAAQSGDSSDTTSSQLEAYDKQIAELDAKITDAKAALAREQAESNASSYANNTYSKTSSSTSDSTSKLNTLAGMSGSYATAKTVASAKNKMEREAATMQSEIDADGARGLSTADKEGELSTLNERLSNASSTLSNALGDINDALADGTDSVSIAPTISVSTSTGDDEDEDDSTANAASSTTSASAASTTDEDEDKTT